MNFRTIFNLLICIFYFGCSKDDPSSNLNNANCRLYATQYRASGTGITSGFPAISTPITVNCNFDKGMLQLICRAPYIDQFQAASTQTRSWLYRNFSDFTEEAKIVGKKLFILSEASDSGFGPNIIPGEGFAVTNNFDDQNRLISSNESIYIEWDSYGRPTKTGPTGICTNDQGRSIEYNDSLRTVTENWNSRTLTRLPDGSVPCIAYHTETKYDENGNITSINNISYEIIETKNVCN